MADFVELKMSGLPPKDPNAQCDGCGVLGTVGRAHHHTDGVIDEMYVYCGKCWPEQRPRLKARWTEEHRIRDMERGNDPEAAPPPALGWGFEGKTWWDVSEGLKILDQLPDDAQPSPELLTEVAAEIAKNAVDLDGPMPPAIQDFVRRHGVG